jgi:hypothetical protein
VPLLGRFVALALHPRIPSPQAAEGLRAGVWRGRDVRRKMNYESTVVNR